MMIDVHYRQECKHGKLISQCRCLVGDKVVEVIDPCPFDCPPKSPPLKLRPGDQPLPVVNDEPDVQSQVIADIEERRQVGIQRYGTALQPNNGRDALRDAYEEAIDLAMYLKQAILERDAR